MRPASKGMLANGKGARRTEVSEAILIPVQAISSGDIDAHGYGNRTIDDCARRLVNFVEEALKW
jgi:hypothetical protein